MNIDISFNLNIQLGTYIIYFYDKIWLSLQL